MDDMQSLCCLIIPIYDFVPSGLGQCVRFFITKRLDEFTYEGRTN